MRELVLIHGRSQGNKDAGKLKKQWVDALHVGLRTAGLDLRIPDEGIRFPYYGDTLLALSKDSGVEAPNVIVRGAEDDPNEQEFITAILKDVVRTWGIAEADIRAASAVPSLIERDIQNWPWVIAALRAIDRVPALSAASLALATRDVYQYLSNPGIQTYIEGGVRQAFTGGEDCVVVSHSLGTVIAYNMLKREGSEHQWNVPTLLTLGSPLAVGHIVQRLAPVKRPECTGDWFNAFDPKDVVALHPLEHPQFPVTPLENYSKVENPTPNHHGITGYLGDPTVARRIHDALLN
ncbi:hypothetical protein ACWCP6_27575 [Streptomyces sp. NPDC002004]